MSRLPRPILREFELLAKAAAFLAKCQDLDEVKSPPRQGGRWRDMRQHQEMEIREYAKLMRELEGGGRDLLRREGRE
jgi:hypothetical protein